MIGVCVECFCLQRSSRSPLAPATISSSVAPSARSSNILPEVLTQPPQTDVRSDVCVFARLLFCPARLSQRLCQTAEEVRGQVET